MTRGNGDTVASRLANKCEVYGKLILRKIIEIVATRCHILKLKCTKFDSAEYPPQTSLGELIAILQPLAGFWSLFLREGRGRRTGGKDKRGGELRICSAFRILIA